MLTTKLTSVSSSTTEVLIDKPEDVLVNVVVDTELVVLVVVEVDELVYRKSKGNER